MPRPYLTMKETLIREYARRGGTLRRRDAKEMLRVSADKTGVVWDFLHQAGYLKAGPISLAGEAGKDDGEKDVEMGVETPCVSVLSSSDH